MPPRAWSTKAGPCEVSLFAGAKVKGDFMVKLPGWLYPVVFNTQTGEANFDNYNGGWGNVEELHSLVQEYSIQVAEAESQQLVVQGWTMERVRQENGDIQVVIEQQG